MNNVYETGYTEQVISSLQSARDRMMLALPAKFGDAFDGDFDTILETINLMKRAANRPVAAQGAMPWLGALGALVCAAGSRHLSQDDQNSAVSKAHSDLSDILRRTCPVVDEQAALKAFTDYFVRNYPGPDTVIFNPKWHAPRIFRAVRAALARATGAQP